MIPPRLWNYARMHRPPTIEKDTAVVDKVLAARNTVFVKMMLLDEFRGHFERAYQELNTRQVSVPSVEDINACISTTFHHTDLHPERCYLGQRTEGFSFSFALAEAIIVRNLLLRFSGAEAAAEYSIQEIRRKYIEHSSTNRNNPKLFDALKRGDLIGYAQDILSRYVLTSASSEGGDSFLAHWMELISGTKPSNLRTCRNEGIHLVLSDLLSIKEPGSQFIYTDGREKSRLVAIASTQSRSLWVCYGRSKTDYLLQDVGSGECTTLRDISTQKKTHSFILAYPWDADPCKKARIMKELGIPVATLARDIGQHGKMFVGEVELAIFNWVDGTPLNQLEENDDLDDEAKRAVWRQFGMVIRQCHDKGIFLADVSGRNAIYSRTQGITLVDLEHVLILDKMPPKYRRMAGDIALDSIKEESRYYGSQWAYQEFLRGYSGNTP